MDREIVVDDTEDNSAEPQQSDDSATQVMPLLYIQQGKLRPAPSTTTNQTIVSTGGTQIAAIINPVNSPIVGGQNNVFIQGGNPVNSAQSKQQHIVIHRPISSVGGSSATTQGQKHILLRKSNTSTAQIVPINTSQANATHAQAGKHTFAYLGTIIKPNKPRDSVVFSPGTLAATQINKQKLVIAPVISQLAQTSSSSTPGIPSSSPKHVTNLLLPVSIPQQSVPSKSSMFNMKINNGQLNADNKGTITVLRESKSSNSSIHPPPLHPITKMTLLAGKGGTNLSDSIKITENPDSAVITPIPKKDDTSKNQPEKRKRTRSNILRGSGDKRKSQNIGKSSKDNLIDYSLSSSESEQDKDKKSQNDDDITLIKVIANDKKSSRIKISIDDDIKIEKIKSPTNSNTDKSNDGKKESKVKDKINNIKTNESKSHEDCKEITNGIASNDPNFDATKVLDWKDGVGTLPGSNLKFCINEFGLMEVVDDDENSKQDKHISIGDKENVCLSQKSSKSSPVTVCPEKKNDDKKSRALTDDSTHYKCENCQFYGIPRDFDSPISCSSACTKIIEDKKQHITRKERDVTQHLSSSVTVRGEKKNEDKKSRAYYDDDTHYQCEMCEYYGIPSNFDSLTSCSPACTKLIEIKKQHSTRKDRDFNKLLSSSVTVRVEKKKEDKKSRAVSPGTHYQCENCQFYGIPRDFKNPISCSSSCTKFEDKKQFIMRIERDLIKKLSSSVTVNADKKNDKKSRTVSPGALYQCKNCDRYGVPDDFDSPISCSSACTEVINDKKRHKMRKERDPNKHLSNSVTVSAEKKNEDKKSRAVSADTLYRCESCGCYGLAAEFESPISCSPSCTEVIEAKKQHMMRKERDLNRDLRAKRKRKRMLQEQQQSKDSDEKSEEKSPKSETDEDTKDTISAIDEESQSEAPESNKYPWQTGKLGFSWAKYLEHCKAKAAPVKLFKDPFPYSKNSFKVGQKMEGIDPEHPSRYCVLTVVEIVGYRLRLHFDGYPENYDFWANADSMDIFYVGFAEKNGHRLDPPKGYVASNFNWNAYLKICKANAAPKTLFANKNTVFPTGFRVGMKLEAVDRKHSSLVCVASIAGLMDSRILVHFDSWDEVYDYWADASSPYIHPVGWCHHNGHSLTPPNNYKDPKSFTWDSYLRETRSLAAPARAFKQRPPCGFKRGMKLEVVDKRIPQLIRVATVEDVKDHMLKIRFDGWPENHTYWVDDDSTDIHPMGWCLKTGHPLEPPLTPESLVERSECGSYGCRGIGHVKGPKFAGHNSASGCPYSLQNLHKVRLLSDRLNVLKHESSEFDDDTLEKQKMNEKPERIKMDRSEVKNERTEKADKFVMLDERFIKTEKQEDADLSDRNDRSENSERSSKSRHHHSDGQTDDDEVSRKRKKRRQTSEELQFSLSNSGYGDPTLGTVPYAINMPDKLLRTEIYQSVYNPGYNPLPDAPHIWAKHSNALNRVVAKQHTNPRRWSNEEVIKFIQSVPNCKEIGSIFRKHSIDGEAFLMLTQEDLVTLLGLRLGPAIKLYNSIVLLRRRAT